MMESPLNDVAEQLGDWFRSILRLAEQNLFGIEPEGPHRDAVVLDTLRRNARILLECDLDSGGNLYSPLCFFLAAACRTLKTPLAPSQWRAALHTVVNLRQRMGSARAELATVGLGIGGPAAIFKHEFDEAINQAGVAAGVSYLNKENRLVALGLAVNWGMRLLLAYALECSLPMNDPSRRDLAWIASLMESLIAAAAISQ